jgi:sirohydrochlorin cobaltochelatase
VSQKTCLGRLSQKCVEAADSKKIAVDEKGTSPDRDIPVRGFFLPGPRLEWRGEEDKIFTIQEEKMKQLTARKRGLFTILAILSIVFSRTIFAMEPLPDKKAIVLAGFGTTYPSALVSITNIQKKVQEVFPKTTVRIAFTSNIIRNIWHQRQQDPQFLNQHKEIPEEILYVKGPLATIADLQDEGYRTVIVQPLHVYAGEEYADLCSYISGLNAITTIKKKYMPFVKLVIGRPVLGKSGPDHDYHEDMETAAKALAPDVALADQKGAALVYMGHGNEFFSTGIYAEFEQVLQKTYPTTRIFVGTVEGFPSLDDVLSRATQLNIKKIMLKPLMIVAGDHAKNDMAGDQDDSWKSTFKRAGIRVECDIHGLGENLEWAEIYVDHIKDAAKDNDIQL